MIGTAQIVRMPDDAIKKTTTEKIRDKQPEIPKHEANSYFAIHRIANRKLTLVSVSIG